MSSPRRVGAFDRDRDPVEFGRVASISDNVFGVALTLLVISIAIAPGLPAGHLGDAILSLWPKFVVIAVSILVVASAWVEHHRFFGMLQRVDGSLVNLNFVYLGLIAFIPLPHQVLGNYPAEPIAYVFYAIVLIAVNALELILFWYALRGGLFRIEPSDPEIRSALRRHAFILAGFMASIPLAYLLVWFTPVVWSLLLPLEQLVARYQRKPAG